MTRFQKMGYAGLLSVVVISIALVAGNLVTARNAESVAEGATSKSISAPLPVSTFVLGELAPPPQLDWYRGLLVPSKEANLGFRRGGRIESIAVEEGSRVDRNELLARLDSSDVRSQLLAIEAQVVEAEALLAELVAGPRAQTIYAAREEVNRLEAILALSQVTSNRQRDLLRSNASSLQQFDEARYSVQQGEAALESAKHRLSELVEGTRKEQIAAQKARVDVLRAQAETLKVDLNDTQILAPFAGVIAKRNVDEGTIASPDAIVLRLIKCDPMEAKFGVAPIDASALQLGAKVQVTIDAQSLDAVVSRIEPELDLASRTQGVFVTIPGGCEAAVIPGQTASLAIERIRDKGMWVPLAGLSRAARGLWSVYVVVDIEHGVGKIERRDVQVIETDTDSARVQGAMIAEGDRLVASGLNRITPGMKVTVGKVSP